MSDATLFPTPTPAHARATTRVAVGETGGSEATPTAVPYADTRDSGIPWLGSVPKHWGVERLKFIARAQFSNVNKSTEEGEQPVRLCNYVDVYYHDRITADVEFMGATAEPREIAKFQLQMGDVLITKDSEDPNDICVPSVVAEPLPGVLCGYHLAQVRPDPDLVCGTYLMYAFRSSGIRDQFRMRANGITRFGLSQDDICSAIFPLPPLPEQQRIAAWLDERTRRIDELVAAKRRLIDLLAEQRTALVTHAVTKGLNPAAPMKPSGIDWLGNVPGHWEVKRLKYLVSEPLQYGANEAAELDDTALPRFVRITDVDESGRLREETFKSLPEDVARPFLLKDGDLLLARSGATVGKAFFYDQSWGRCCYAGYLIRARLHSARLVAKFAHYCTQSDGYWQWITSSQIQATIQNVSAEKYANLWIGVPPFPEQRAIVAHLDAACAKLDALITTTETAIARLTEYRQAIISAAVTGKIDTDSCKGNL